MTCQNNILFSSGWGKNVQRMLLKVSLATTRPDRITKPRVPMRTQR